MEERKNVSDSNSDISRVLSLLKQAYAITDQFRDIVESEIVGKQDVLPMTSTYEGLGSAMAFIGEALDILGDPGAPAYEKHVIGVDDTRDEIRSAYGICDEASRNIRPDSPLAGAAAYLKSCMYSLLDLTFSNDSQESLGKSLEICEIGDDVLDDIEAMPEEERDACYISPEAIKLHEKASEIRTVFEKLRPRHKPGSSDA